LSNNVAALAALAAASTAFAQSTATISGSISVGVVDTGAAGDTSQVFHLGNGANAININTVEDLGGGLKGGFSAQIRYNAANGNMNSNVGGTTTNPLFHAANAYLSGGFGTVRIGRIAEASTCGLDPWACGGGAAMAAGVGVSSLAGAGSQASSISYATPTVSGFSAGYQTTLTPAAGTAASATAAVGRTNERSVLNVNYANGPITAMLLQVDGGASTGTTAADDTSKANAIGASYNFGVAKLNLVNVVNKSAAGVKTADVTSLSATMPMGAYTLLAGYSKSKTGTGYTATAVNDTKIAAGVNYALSKRTTLGADVFKAEAANAGTGFVLRMAHTF
jgi:predicted porin